MPVPTPFMQRNWKGKSAASLPGKYVEQWRQTTVYGVNRFGIIHQALIRRDLP